MAAKKIKPLYFVEIWRNCVGEGKSTEKMDEWHVPMTLSFVFW